jgi:hypothetical protein
MTMMQPEKFLRTMRKTPVILAAILRGVTQDQAQAATDGPDGWSVVEVMCHLRDYEELFFRRARMILETDNPKLPGYDQAELARERDYAHQDLAAAFQEYVDTRQQYLNLLTSLDENQWQRTGIHPETSDITLLELAMNIGLHDVNHIEQIAHTLGLAKTLVT